MNKYEDKFKQSVMKALPLAYTKKMPDYKQTLSSSLRGLPDFLVINEGRHIWFEVKFTDNTHTFNFNDIWDTQWIEFRKMCKAGAYVYIAIYLKNQLCIVDFNDLYNKKFKDGLKNIKDTELVLLNKEISKIYKV